MTTYTINTTDFTLDSNGNPDRITMIHWSATKTEGELTVSSYGAHGVDIPATTTEVELIELLEEELDVETQLDAQLDALNAPTTASGKPWIEQHPVWREGVAYAVNDLVAHQGIVYRVIQAHTSQRGWPPNAVPALFTVRGAEDPEAGPEAWVQPTGAHDAYQIGDRVTHDNPNDGGAIWIYESKINANTTEPGRDGMFDRWWEPTNRA